MGEGRNEPEELARNLKLGLGFLAVADLDPAWPFSCSPVWRSYNSTAPSCSYQGARSASSG